MKKKIVRKGKKVIKSGTHHWTAFDERINGPTKLAALMDEFIEDVLSGRVITISQFRAKKRFNKRHWHSMMDTYPNFRESMDVIRDAIYGKRHEMVAYDGAPPSLLKDCYRYSNEDVEQDFNILERAKEADHERKQDLEEIKKKVQAGDSDKSFEVNLYLDGKRINRDAEK